MLEQKICIIHLMGIAGFLFLYAAIECMGIYASVTVETMSPRLRATEEC